MLRLDDLQKVNELHAVRQRAGRLLQAVNHGAFSIGVDGDGPIRADRSLTLLGVTLIEGGPPAL